MASFNPATTAVLVIDVQVGVFEAQPAPLDAVSVLARINQVTAAARGAGASVIFLQHDGDPNGDWLTPFTSDWELHQTLTVDVCDRVIRKTACDGFYRTDLEDCLNGMPVETLVITGYATDLCVDTTIRSAASREYKVVAVKGAHTTKDRPGMSAAQIVAHHEWLWSNLICPKGVSLVSSAKAAESFRRET